MGELRVNSFSSCNRRWNYDVFLSFRGLDTRRNFTGNLYNTLHQKGIHTFMDDRELMRGREISAALLQAIEQSRISIIIFSENYAFSPWCLDELVKIMECYKIRGQLVWPLFYNVDPSVVRYQTKSFGIAMAEHVNKFKADSQKVQKWRFVLNEAANLSGWHFTNGYEFEFIQQIVEEISSILNRSPLYVTDHPVGLESRLSYLSLQLGMGLDDVRMIGICGFGGTGKSTLAQALYNLIADQFEGASFVADVREDSSKQGLLHLQEKFLAEILGERNIQLGNVNKGISIIRRRLHSKKVLLILDDVQKPEHLQNLAGDLDWFGPGSRIVVTTRDKHLLIERGAKMFYEMGKLNYDEALELFSWHAFRRNIPVRGFEYVAKRAVCYANGLPLALKIIGSNLYGKGLGEWSCTLDKYERVPSRDIQNILQISYDNLEENEKEIFLDLACFFKGEKLEYVEKILDACGFHPKSGIGLLIDKSLIKIEDNRVKMHDLIQDMGREIIRQSSRLNPGKRSRLWFHEDILEVLTNNAGTDKIEGIMLELHEEKEVQWSGDAFREMPNLRIIVIRNALFSSGPTYLPNSLRVLDWSKYPSPSLPEDFHPRKIVVMSLPGSHLTLEMPFKEFKYLTFMDFTGCEFLKKIPDMSAVPNLTILKLDFCQNLVEIHDSVGYLSKLVILSAHSLVKLESFPPVIKLMSLEHLDLGGFSSSQIFPDVLEKLENVRTVDLRGTAITELPSSMGYLLGLKHLGLDYCTSLWNIPSSIEMLKNLTSISMECCPQVIPSLTSNLDFWKCRYALVKKLNFQQCGLSDDALPLIVHCFPNVEYLNLSKNKFVTILECINKLYSLQRLHLDDCKLLKKIKGCPCNLVLLSATNCDRLTSQSINMLGVVHQQSSDKSLEVILPATPIPECFNYCFGQGNMSFWVRKNFPDIPLCLVSEMEDEEKLEEDYYATFKIWIHINDLPFLKFSVYRDCGKTHNHVRLIHLHSYISECSSVGLESLKNVDTFLQLEWNHVDILWKVEFFRPTEGSDLGITGRGIVHIYGIQNKMEDILFWNPCSAGIDTVLCTTAETRDKMVNSQGEYSYLQTTNDDESVDGADIILPHKDGEEDLHISLLLSQNDPLTLRSQNIWIKDNEFLSHELVNCIPDEKCFTRGQGMTWDPMEMEYHLTYQKEQLVSIVQRDTRDVDNGSRWRFSLCALISSVVLLCSSSSSNSL